MRLPEPLLSGSLMQKQNHNALWRLLHAGTSLHQPFPSRRQRATNKHELQHNHQVPYKAETAKRVLFPLWHDKQCTALSRIKNSARRSCRLVVLSLFGRLISHSHKEQTHRISFPPKWLPMPSEWSQNLVSNYFWNDNLDSGTAPCYQKVILSEILCENLFTSMHCNVFFPPPIFCLVTQNTSQHLKYFGANSHLTYWTWVQPPKCKM